MRQRSFLLLAVTLVVMIFGSVGVYAYDSSNDEIAEGTVLDSVRDPVIDAAGNPA